MAGAEQRQFHSVEEVSVELGRASLHASWGFKTYDGVCPLRVRDVAAEIPEGVRRGDEIIAINGIRPGSYDEGMSLLHQAQSTVQLCVRRKVSGSKCATTVDEGAEPRECEYIGIEPNSWRNRASLHSLSPSAEWEGTISPQQQQRKPADQTTATSCHHSESGVRTSAQLALDKVLLAACGKDAHCEDTITEGTTDTEGPPSGPSRAPLSINSQVAGIWRGILTRKRKRLDDASRDSKNYMDVCSVLPKLTHQVIYDCQNCPFSIEEGFVPEFHKSVQYIMTERALSQKHAAGDEDGDGDAKVMLAPVKDRSDEDLSAVMAQVEAKKAQCEKEVSQRDTVADVHRMKKMLSSQQSGMLKVVESHRESLLQKLREDVGWYRETECSAQDFFALHSKAISWCRKASIKQSPVDSKVKYPAFHHGNREGHKRHEHPQLLPPPPPPPPPPLSQPHFPPPPFAAAPSSAAVVPVSTVSPRGRVGYVAPPGYARRLPQHPPLFDVRTLNATLYHR
ncbi:hypothetical protein, conserved [Trypanosoma brucei gambiense DAL972]|uniref:PDZ domain-containing protein n=2 Tax=Trypanosoma brucei TaxID=5691 RepID=D0A388_TRYB9|nr:hypothetical protein, conserved [Trypanosoma brucei gambiense DAL972]RHW69398.1 hypothetical protein DPX39_100073000 [Trypanosoma brucei equiperdum]CBH15732.1 hypothetical protein, conserved [Trypanosoma brucei gambiense DAL972]|eukprot:XP_011777996.1 hypothetical protein, conserved [Trypanosoma brucei gambiense DAL972]